MDFKLATWGLGSFPEIEINEKQFQSLCQENKVLKAAMAIEEKYELIISNYLELEKDSLSISSSNMLRRSNNYSEFFDVRSTFNRRIVNLLTSTKLYLDSIYQHVKVCNLDLANIIKLKTNKEYDSVFEYRFMEALRNHVQHYGLAVHLIKKNSSWIEHDDSRLLEFKTKIYTQKSDLENDKTFKKLILNEMPDKVELILSSRKYIGSISRIHECIRVNIDCVVKSSRDLIETTIKEYEDINGGESTGLYAIKTINNDRVPLFLSWDDVRLELIDKNPCIANLENRYVSGKCI
ncbi:hypothetical protein ACFO1C_001582 [Photobacterium damselae]